jgi:putative membrane protein
LEDRFGMMGGDGMGFSWLILIVIVVFAYFMFNKKNNQNENDEDSPSVKDILDKKFANGEIDEDEYKKKREILK